MKAHWPNFFASLGFAERPFSAKALKDQLQWDIYVICLFMVFKMKTYKYLICYFVIYLIILI